MNHDERLIQEYLEQFPGQFISPMEIAKRADSRQRFKAHPGWARAALHQLEQQNILETDNHDHYRIKEKAGNGVQEPSKSDEYPQSHCYVHEAKVVEASDEQTFYSILYALGWQERCDMHLRLLFFPQFWQCPGNEVVGRQPE
jgi:hypothetical protein